MVPMGSRMWEAEVSLRRWRKSGAVRLSLRGDGVEGAVKGSSVPRFRFLPVRFGRVTLMRMFLESMPVETSFFAKGSFGRRETATIGSSMGFSGLIRLSPTWCSRA